MTRDFGLEAHQAAERRLDDLGEWNDHWEEHCGDECDCPDGPPPEPEMAGPFCGCQTCVVREALDAAWPILLEAARLEVNPTG